MLKIKKLKPEDLEDLEFNNFRKLVKPLLLAAKKQHKEANDAVDFFILTDFEFSDKPGKKTTIFIPGKHTAEWKKYLKTKFKEDKKNMMMGTCFVKETDGKEVLNLSPIRGVAKMMKIKKQGKRMFAMAKLTVELASGAEELKESAAAANMGGRIIDEEDDDDEDDEATARNSKPDAKELKAQFKELAKQIGNIKKGIPALKEAAAKAKNNTATADDAEQVELIIDEMEAFLEDFEEAHEKVQKRIAPAKKRVEAQLPKVAQLMERLQQLAPQSLDDIEDDEDDEIEEEEGDDNATDNRGANVQISPEVVQQLRQTMAAAKTEINKLVQELNLDELLKGVA